MWQKVIKLSIYALVFLMPLFWLSFSFEAFEFNKGYLLFILVSIGILAWLGKMIFQDKEIRFRRTPLDLYVLGFLVVMIFSALFSQDKITSLLGFYGRFWPSLMGILSLGGFYFLITNNVKAKEGLIRISGLLKVFLWSAFLAVSISYFSLFGIWARIENVIPGNWQFPQLMKLRIFNSIGGSLEQLAIFLAFISVLVIGLLAFKEKPASAPAGATAGKGEKRGNLGFYLLLFASLFLLMLTDFWPAWLMILLTLLCFLGFAFWKRVFKEDVGRLSLSIFFLLIALIFLLFNPLQSLLPQDSSFSNLPSEVLLEQGTSWSVAGQGLKEHLVLGAGLGNFSYTFAKFKSVDFLQSEFWQIRFDRAGNHIAEIFGTVGILGILSYFLMVGMFLMISLMILKSKSQNPNDKSNPKEPYGVSNRAAKIQIPLLLGFVVLFIGQFVFYQNIILAFSFWLFLGLTVVSWDRTPKEKVYSFKDFPEVGLIFSVIFWVVLIGFAFCFFSLGKYYLADVKYKSYLVNPTQNLKNLEEATRLAEKRGTYHIVLARTYLQRFAQEAAKSTPDNQVIGNMVALAVAEGKAATELSPNRVAAQETLGVIYRDIRGVAQGALEWGTKSFENALALEPRNPVLLTELGKLKVIDNRITEARELFRRAVELMPEYLDANLQLSLLDESEQRIEEAIRRMETLAQFYPFNTEVLFQLGRLYYNSDRIDEAVDLFQQIIRFAPNHANAHYSLGLAYERRGENESALREFEKVLELNPGNEDVVRKIEELRK